MPRPAGTEPPDSEGQASRNTAQSRKRKASDTAGSDDSLEPGETYDPSNERFPDEPWYALDYEDIIMKIGDLCDNLVIPLQEYASFERGIKELVDAAQAAKILPSITKLFLAVLGEQGTGKSTLINALLDRKLLERSGGGSSCTAYATVIIHKDGADDHTQLSDVAVEYLNDEEISISINEQIQRWSEVYPGTHAQQHADSEDEDDAPVADGIPTKGSTCGKGTGSGNQIHPKKISDELRRSTETAKEFFEIIFDTKENNGNINWLEYYLYQKDISQGDFFFTMCYRQAKERLTRLGTTTIDIVVDVSDRHLARKKADIKKYWPFVKIVTIATGHILLRHGMCLFDLPGYGDTSQLRQAVINTFRLKADVEMVVVPSQRVQTSITQEEYIGRSIHLKGPEKTVLVMNKSDELVNADNMEAQINQIDEEPFTTFMARFEQIEMLKAEGTKSPRAIAALTNQLVKDVSAVIIPHETEFVQRQMKKKGIKVYSASALAYTEWTDLYRTKEPSVGPKASGIPTIRQLLFQLPAEKNYLNYHDHVFKVLSALRKQAGRVTEKHPEDKSYAAMREDLRQKIPVVKYELVQLTVTQIERLMARPWSLAEEQDIVNGIEQLIECNWVHRLIHWSGFAKMLREYGIPMGGRYYGRNLNRDVLGTMVNYIDKWLTAMQQQAEQLANCLNNPVRLFLAQTETSVNKSSADPALKERAIDALGDASQLIETAYELLLNSLHGSLRENHLNFTTEIDIYGPIAQEMRAVYERARDSEITGSGAGIYGRRRETMRTSIVDPRALEKKHPCIRKIRPLLKTLEEKIVSRQKEVWKANCNTFITTITAQLNGFRDITEDLLKNAAYMTQKHEEVRELLKTLLVDFDRGLTEIQCRFTGMELQRIRKKARHTNEEQSSAQSPPPQFDPQNATVLRKAATLPTKYPEWLRFPGPSGCLS